MVIFVQDVVWFKITNGFISILLELYCINLKVLFYYIFWYNKLFYGDFLPTWVLRIMLYKEDKIGY